MALISGPHNVLGVMLIGAFVTMGIYGITTLQVSLSSPGCVSSNHSRPSDHFLFSALPPERVLMASGHIDVFLLYVLP